MRFFYRVLAHRTEDPLEDHLEAPQALPHHGPSGRLDVWEAVEVKGVGGAAAAVGVAAHAHERVGLLVKRVLERDDDALEGMAAAG